MWDTLNRDPCCSCNIARSKVLENLCDMDDPFSAKENIQPLIKNEELSMYDSEASQCTHSHCSHHCSHRVIERQRSLEDHDGNSQDSGYSASYHGERNVTCSSSTRVGSFGSSWGSFEDEFLDFTDAEPLEKARLPQDFGKLIANPIIQKTKPKDCEISPSESSIRPYFRRALSLQNHLDDTPTMSRARTSLFRGSDEVRSFKRPDPPSTVESILIKRSKIFDDDDEDASVPVTRPPLQRTMSATEESIMCAVQRSSTEPDLIGDYSKNFSLPLTQSRHQDLKAITPVTLSRVIKGEFKDAIDSFKVIDCRYPYEYDGGHIMGAMNVYTKEQCVQLLDNLELPLNSSHKRNVLIFHCEFSSERGPNLYRCLRQEDRHRNESLYPSLFYPEIYLLEGGYKNFFEQFSELCTPVAYTRMLHPDHEEDLKHFRQKSKTWNCGTRNRQSNSKSLKRLGM